MEVQLIVEKGPARSRFIKLRSRETVVGRQKGCNVRIPSAEVSRRHCLLRLDGVQLTVEDLNSANGTYLNNRRVSGQQPVASGDRLRIGPLTFAVEYEAPQMVNERKPVADAPASATEPEPAFELIDDSDTKIPAGRIPPLQVGDEGESFEVVLDDSEPLNLPEGEEFRNLLNKMDH
jgi:pSer/pThr/pTyr-binding forkhead associated (FHA) protein